jgi:hypothetical protein
MVIYGLSTVNVTHPRDTEALQMSRTASALLILVSPSERNITTGSLQGFIKLSTVPEPGAYLSLLQCELMTVSAFVNAFLKFVP